MMKLSPSPPEIELELTQLCADILARNGGETRFHNASYEHMVIDVIWKKHRNRYRVYEVVLYIPTGVEVGEILHSNFSNDYSGLNYIRSTQIAYRLDK